MSFSSSLLFSGFKNQAIILKNTHLQEEEEEKKKKN